MVLSDCHLHLKMAEPISSVVKTLILNASLIKAKRLFQDILSFLFVPVSEECDNFRKQQQTKNPAMPRHGRHALPALE